MVPKKVALEFVSAAKKKPVVGRKLVVDGTASS